MADNIISSFNIFVDTDRGDPNGLSTADKFDLHLNSVNVNAEKGQFIRLTLNNFSMYKTWPNVNARNSKFLVRTTDSDATDFSDTVALTHQNYRSVNDLAEEFAKQVGEALKTQVIAQSGGNASNATHVDVSNVLPEATTTEAGTTSHKISFRIVFLDGPPPIGGGTALAEHKISKGAIQFHSYTSDNDTIHDTYSLLGGDRVYTDADTTTSSVEFDMSQPNWIDITCKYPAQRMTEQFVYIRTNLQSNTLETSSLRDGHHSRDTSTRLHHSNILARVPMSNEFVQYDAGTGREYFMDLTGNKHLQNVKLELTDSHGLSLPYEVGQNKLGNLNFSCVIRVDVIQKNAPHERFSKEYQRPMPPRFSNPQTQFDGLAR